MKIESLILAAATLGTLAFNSGRKAIPACDPEMINLIKSNPNKEIGASLPLLNAWNKAWHDANLAKQP